MTIIIMNDMNDFMERSMSIETAVNGGSVRQKSEDLLRVERIGRREIEFIDSNEFESMFASKESLHAFEQVGSKRAKSDREFRESEQLACLAPALSEPLLSFAEEQHEFRRMNFLKYSAARLRTTLSLHRPSRKKLDEIERLLSDAVRARDHIIRANLRLVISNAGKYCSASYCFEDLVSDGSLALMDAVDKFDYQRGFRFSTYATHAIRRSYFRKIERRQKDRSRFVVTDPDVLATKEDHFEVDHDAPAQSRLMEHVVGSLAGHLTERELHIVEGRFGLNGRSGPLTLMQLSGELGICKERVRQVEGLALQKLHAVAVNFSEPPNEVLESLRS